MVISFKILNKLSISYNLQSQVCVCRCLMHAVCKPNCVALSLLCIYIFTALLPRDACMGAVYAMARCLSVCLSHLLSRHG